MRWFGLAAWWLVLCHHFGCQPPPPDPGPGKSGPSPQATKPFDASLLQPLLLKEKPANAKSVAEVRKEVASGETVAVKGVVPPATVYRIKQTFAEIKLMDEEVLNSDEIKSAFAADEGGEPCPACAEKLNKLSVTVELVGPSGDTPLKTTLQGFQSISYGSTLYFVGKLHKNGEHVKVLAEKLYVEER